ncbi:MAG: DUF2149 domain-containing protein [Actinobacteria bacterium]|nr:DUF2149 domain-containing protein [Actinomycetota bacterium]
MSPQQPQPPGARPPLPPAVPRRRAFVTPHAGRREDRAGDPLEGLVNLFDLGIVLAVAFLLAALASLNLSGLLTSEDVTVTKKTDGQETVIRKKGDHVQAVELSHRKVVGTGERIGQAYRLADGRVVIVRPPKSQR